MKYILNNLRRTKDILLVNGNRELRLDGYADSDFQYDFNDRMSTSGFIFSLNGEAVNQKSNKYNTIVDSTTEVEYLAASEVTWNKKFLIKLRVAPSIELSLLLYCDNNGAIPQTKELRSHNMSKTFSGGTNHSRDRWKRQCSNAENNLNG